MSEGAGRLFLGVPLTEQAREAVEAHLRAAPGPLPGRPTPPSTWHLTLRFLGDTPRDAADRLRARLGDTDLGAPFVLRFGRPGAFPREARAAVLWLGLSDGEPQLRRLAATVEAAVVAAGFAAEPRPFAPHLTLARLRPPVDLRSLLQDLPPLDLAMPVERVVLYRSHLGQGPARYQVVEEWPLA